jgi:hypothetical protein
VLITTAELIKLMSQKIYVTEIEDSHVKASAVVRYPGHRCSELAVVVTAGKVCTETVL